MFRSLGARLRPRRLNRGGVLTEIAPPPRLILADGHAVVEAARAGFGIAQACEVTCAAAVMAGDLVPILPELAAAGPPVHVLLRGRPADASAKVRVVVDHLAASLYR